MLVTMSSPLPGARSLSAIDRAPEGPILIVEDDRATAELVRLYLVRDGFSVITAADGVEGLRLARERKPKLIVLDLMLPKMDGLELCRTLRADSNTPIIMVTARVEEEDRLTGLDLGADDYVPKPFRPRELVARVRAVLRRAQREEGEEEPESIARGDLVADLALREVTVGGQPIRLTASEFRLLIFFMEAPGRVLSREQIIQGAFGNDYAGFDRTVDTHISNLRRKLTQHSGERRYIHTVYGMGYRFDVA